MRWLVILCGVSLLAFPVGADAEMGAAQRAYVDLWKSDRAAFGLDGKPPLMRFVPKGGGYTSTGSVGSPTVLGPQSPGAAKIINIGVAARRQLKSGRPGAQQAVRYALEHEFARVFQNPSGPDPNAGAGVANAVTNKLTHFRNTGRDNPTKYLQKHLPYWGQDPRTILWPLP